MDAMMARLRTLEDEKNNARSSERALSPPTRRQPSLARFESGSRTGCSGTPDIPTPAPGVMQPRSTSVPGRAACEVDESSTATDRIVDAIHSMNTAVRSNHSYISNFDPNLHNIDDWCEEVDRAKNLNNWSDHECLSRIGNCLKGDSRTWLNEWVTSDRTWSNFKREFKPLCPKTPDIAGILFEVMSTNSDKYPTYADYARRSLLRLRIVRGLSDELISAIVIRGITDPQIRASATNAKLSPSQLVEFFSIYVKPSAPKNNSHTTQQSVSSGKEKFHPQSGNSRKRRIEDGKCFSCGQLGHTRKNCNKKTRTDQTPAPSSDVSSTKPAFVPTKPEQCTFCKKVGHKIDTCFAKQRSESRNNNKVNFCRENETTSNNDVVVAVIQGVPVDILIDSGSTISLVSSSMLKHFHCSQKPAFRVLKGLGSQEIESTSYVTLSIEFDGITLEVDLFIVASEFMNTPVIVGTDVLNREGVRYVRTRDSQTLVRENVDTHAVMTVQPVSSIPINTPLIEDKLQQLLAIVNEFSQHFISGTATSTVTTGSMTIRLNSNTPVYYRPYRLSHAETLRVREIIKDLLDKQIIQESESEYASPILLVKKKDGSDRMCVDYRKLNDLTVKDRFSLPRIDDHIDRLGQNKFFTSLDMATGFH